MTRQERKVDQYGFPLPVTFDGHEASQRPSLAPKLGRFRKPVLLVILIAVIGLVAGPFLAPMVRTGVSRRFAEKAEVRLEEDDLRGSLANLDRALWWSPDDPELLAMRAEVRLEANRVKDALDDLNQVIHASPNYSTAYQQRSLANERLGKHRESIDDATTAIRLRPSDDPEPLNDRAYMRALAGTDWADNKLDEALADIEKAIKLGGPNGAFLDTRGYLRYLTGSYEPALQDLNDAIQLQQPQRDQWQKLLAFQGRSLRRQLRLADQALAVMYHHRGLVQQKLGHEAEADTDRKRGEELGYNPAAGVY